MKSNAITRLSAALEYLLDNTERPPEPSCACHLSPPCNDCVDYDSIRDAISNAKDALNAPDEPFEPLPTAPLGDPSDRMRLANAIASSLEADPALVDDLRNALTDRVATRLRREWKRDDDERSHITTGSMSDAVSFFRPG